DAVIVVRTPALDEVRKTLLKAKLDAVREAWGYSTVKGSSQNQDDAVTVNQSDAVTVPSEAQGNGLEKPVGARERATLLTIIAALAKEAKIDVTKASKAGVTISNLTSAMGQEIAPNTVARHLRNLAKLFPDLKSNDSPPE